MGAKFLRWSLFTVIIALLPFIFVYFAGNYLTLWHLISDKKADIVFMGVAFCAVGIGELLESATSNIEMPKIWTHLLLGFSIVVIIWAALLYSGISLGKVENVSVFHICFIFGASMFCSTICILLSEFLEKKITENALKAAKEKHGNEVIQIISEHSDIDQTRRNQLIIDVCKKLNLSLSPQQVAHV